MVIVAGNEGGGFLFPRLLVCSWATSPLSALSGPSTPASARRTSLCFLFHLKFLNFSLLKYGSLSFAVLCFTSSCMLLDVFPASSPAFSVSHISSLNPRKLLTAARCLFRDIPIPDKTVLALALMQLLFDHFKRRGLVGEDGVRGGRSSLAGTSATLTDQRSDLHAFPMGEAAF